MSPKTSFGALGATVSLVLAVAPSAHATSRHGHAPGAPAQAAHGPTYKIGSLVIEAPWSRATPGGAKVAGGFLRITNTGAVADRLIGGSMSLAGRLEVHEMTMRDNVMRMRPLDQGLEIEPGRTVELKPGGYHLMFMDLKEPLREGRTVPGTLVFEKAGTIAIEYAVRSIAARSGAPAH